MVVDKEIASKLVENEVQSIPDLAKLTKADLKKLLKCDDELASQIIKTAENAAKDDNFQKSSPLADRLLKLATKDEHKIVTRRKNNYASGPMKRIFAFIGNFTAIIISFIFLGELAEVKVLLSEVCDPLWKFIGPVLSAKLPFIGVYLPQIIARDLERVLPFIVYLLAVQLCFHLLFGVSLGQFLMGLKQGRGFFVGRILAIFRWFFGYLFMPLIISDLPILFRRPTLKETCSFSPVFRGMRSLNREVFALILLSFCSLMMGVVVYLENFRNWDSAEVIAYGEQQIIERIRTYFAGESYSPKRSLGQNFRHKVKVGSIRAIKGDLNVTAGGRTKNALLLSKGEPLYDRTTIETLATGELNFEMVGGEQIKLAANSRIVVDYLEKGKVSIIYLKSGHVFVKMPKSTLKSDSIFVISPTGVAGLGDEYLVVYNLENDITSAVSLRGYLRFSKFGVRKSEKREKVGARKRFGRAGMSMLLKEAMSVGLFEGDFASTLKVLPIPTRAARLAVLQMKVLTKRDFTYKQSSTPGPGSAEQKERSELLDLETGKYFPRAGGYLDTATALYLAPGSDAIFDNESAIYLLPKSENNLQIKVDPLIGSLIMPSGLTLTAKEGVQLVEQTEDQIANLANIAKNFKKSQYLKLALWAPSEGTSLLRRGEGRYGKLQRLTLLLRLKKQFRLKKTD